MCTAKSKMTSPTMSKRILQFVFMLLVVIILVSLPLLYRCLSQELLKGGLGTRGGGGGGGGGGAFQLSPYLSTKKKNLGGRSSRHHDDIRQDGLNVVATPPHSSNGPLRSMAFSTTDPRQVPLTNNNNNINENDKKKTTLSILAKILHWEGALLKRGHPQWQSVDHELWAFVYGAHFDDVNDPPLIRVVGIARSPLAYHNVTCHLYYHKNDYANDDYDSLDTSGGVGDVVISDVSGSLHLQPDKELYMYRAAYVECPLGNFDPSKLPYAVSISKVRNRHSSDRATGGENIEVSSDTDRKRDRDRIMDDDTVRERHRDDAYDGSKERYRDFSNYMIINYSTQQQQQQHQQQEEQQHPHGHIQQQHPRGHLRHQQQVRWRWNVTRCFPPIFGGLDNPHRVAELVSLSVALGVDHFVFYVKDSGPQLLRMLQVLEEQGLAEVLPWNLEMGRSVIKAMEGGPGIHYQGQYPACQDCLARHLHTSRFIIFGDLDELFVPRKHRSLMPVLSEVFEQKPQCGAFRFRHVMFPLKKNEELQPHSTETEKGRQESNVNPQKGRLSHHAEAEKEEELSPPPVAKRMKGKQSLSFKNEDIGRVLPLSLKTEHGNGFLSPRANTVKGKQSTSMEDEVIERFLTSSTKTQQGKQPLPYSEDFSRLSASSVRLTALTNVVREADPWNIRSKPVVDPRKVFTLGVHAVRVYRKGYIQCWLDPKEAVMHHYRRGSKGKAPRMIRDTYLYHYASESVRTMIDLLRRFNGNVSKPYH